MTPQEEIYTHFWYCINDLNEAWSLLQRIKTSMDNPLRDPAFEYALIIYSRPYTRSYGITIKKHKLDDKYVPDEHRDLHNKILTNRDQIRAHTDLTTREPKLHVVKNSYGKIVQLTHNTIYIATELPNIDSIINLIEQSLDGMYAAEEILKATLPANSP